jgi:hypothetical protein
MSSSEDEIAKMEIASGVARAVEKAIGKEHAAERDWPDEGDIPWERRNDAGRNSQPTPVFVSARVH